MTDYPYPDGDTIVIGPECFAAHDGAVLCWRGQNYVPQEETGRLYTAIEEHKGDWIRANGAANLSRNARPADLKLWSATDQPRMHS